MKKEYNKPTFVEQSSVSDEILVISGGSYDVEIEDSNEIW